VTDLIGDKIESAARLKTLEKRLLDAAAGVAVTAESEAA
jgi:[protein-PII] uridylyltransferase